MTARNIRKRPRTLAAARMAMTVARANLEQARKRLREAERHLNECADAYWAVRNEERQMEECSP